jgi:hypothetical protein
MASGYAMMRGVLLLGLIALVVLRPFGARLGLDWRGADYCGQGNNLISLPHDFSLFLAHFRSDGLSCAGPSFPRRLSSNANSDLLAFPLLNII